MRERERERERERSIVMISLNEKLQGFGFLYKL